MIKRTILLILLLFLSLSYAQVNEAVDIGSGVEGVGVRALSLGGAYTAVADDYAAIFWNPAGLAQMKKIEFEFSLHYLNRQTTTDYEGSINSEAVENFKLSSLAFIYPYPVFRGSLVFGFAFQRIKNYDMKTMYAAFDTSQNFFPIEYEYADGSPVNPFYMNDVERSELIDESGSLKKWTASAATDFSQNLSAGISLNLYTGNYYYKNHFSQLDILNKYQSVALGQDVNEVTGIRNFQYDFYGIELGFGVLYHITRNWRVGGRIDLPLSFYVTEGYNEVNSIYFDNISDTPISDYLVYEGEEEYTFSYPAKYSLGSSFYLYGLLISAQFDYRNWTDLEIENIEQTEESSISDLSEEIDYRFGIEYLFPEIGFSIAGGFHSHLSPTHDSGNFLVVNSYSVGIGYIFSRSLAIDMGGILREYKDQSAGDDIMPMTAERSYDYFDIRVGLKYHY